MVKIAKHITVSGMVPLSTNTSTLSQDYTLLRKPTDILTMRDDSSTTDISATAIIVPVI